MRTKDVNKRVAPLWHKALITLCFFFMLMYTFFVAIDAKIALGWVAQFRTGTILQDRNISNQFPPPQDTPHTVTRIAPKIITDDASCLARTQHLLYRRDPEQFAPSPALDKAWKRYEELHKACSSKKNWTHEFLNERGKQDDCNYLIVLEGSGGLGNKLLALTSAFTYALATDRVVLVYSKDQFKDLLCDPFLGSSWFLPPEFPYQNVSDAPSLNVAIEKDFRNIDLVLLHLDHVQSWADSQFFCDHTHFKLMGVRWVGWTSNQYYVTRLLMIPSIWERLNPLFTPGEVFTQLSHRILLPRNKLWAHIVRLIWGYLEGSGKRVGLQVRLHGRPNLGDYDPVVFDRILDCLQNHKVLPKLKEEENIDDLKNLFMKRWEDGEKGNSDISVLVTSLQSRYFDEIKDLYGGKPNENNTMIRFHMVSHLGHQDSSVYQSQIAFVEMWLLSFSDVIATSAYSTFGYVPQGIGGLRPLILNIKADTADGTPSCSIGQSTQPCTHFPLKPRCEGSTENVVHTEWMRHHIQECQDHGGGLQLVSEVEQPNNSTRLWESKD